ncbi:hypothetical protein PRIC2_014578 [Phytophthora ramorum]
MRNVPSGCVSSDCADPTAPIPTDQLDTSSVGQRRHEDPDPDRLDTSSTGQKRYEDPDPDRSMPVVESELNQKQVAEPLEDEHIYHHEAGDLLAEDVEGEMAVLPEITAMTSEVTY